MNSESNVTATSRGSYLEHVKSGKARSQRMTIYHFLRNHQLPRNRREISLITGIAINAVTGRVNSMLENFRDCGKYSYGDLIVDHVAVDPVTNRPVEYVTYAPLEPTQLNIW